MIQANELRIGNWVLNKRYKSGYEMQIESIGEFGLNIELGYDGLNPVIDDDCGFNECEPIPLTEEWMVKFGFYEKYKSSSNRWNMKWFELHDCEDDEGNLTGVFMYDFRIQIKYVHQLQNLYFALTGEELTINEL